VTFAVLSELDPAGRDFLLHPCSSHLLVLLPVVGVRPQLGELA
jgi:hypothetical protein